ncbi:MAG: hypothetical protein KBC57_04780 [Neisseriaceae bacterium]|nr:hypothetical protein [Neisseriaceae bacterium]MBP6861656.1 hypothetical protein [Neisseriaceae bacterium]
MTHYLIELYTPKTSWLNLAEPAKQAYLDQVKQGMAALSDLGVQILALAPAQANPQPQYDSPHRYVGIWAFPSPEVRQALLHGIAATGWYDYFDHVNASVDGGDLPSHLTDLFNDRSSPAQTASA